MKYRSDIDGIRAIAVLLVVLFHAGFTVFASGFIGVDIFFVISGFLIASIIKDRMDAGKFSFSDFYLRRLWRLQPAMLAMMAFCFVLASVFWLPEDYAPFLKSIKQTLLIVSNRYFGDETTAYAAPDSNAMLLLHTWSLSIEWQWYLFFPIIYYFFRKKTNERTIKYGSLLITVVGIAITWHYTSAQPTKTYYFFASRFFEFMLGVCVCIYLPLAKRVNTVALNIISLLAIIVIFTISFRTDVILGYPNVYTLAVCLSTAIVIFSGSRENILINNCLSFSPLVWLGKISYSLYLFHWPIFATLHYIGITHVYARLAGLCLSILLAVGSYYFVEKPYRKPRQSLKKTLIILLVAPLLAIIVLIPVSKHFDGFSYLRFGETLHHINSVLKETKLKQRQDCMNANVSGTDMACVVGDKTSSERAILMGDSHSNQYWNFFDVMGKNAKVAVDMKATSLCLAIPGVYHDDLYTYKGDHYQICHENVEKYYDAIRSHKYKYVIISQVWENYAAFRVRDHINDTPTQTESINIVTRATGQAVQAIIDAGAQPILVKSMFPMPENYLTCFYEHFKTRGEYEHQSCNPQPQINPAVWTEKMYATLQAKFPSLIVIDPKRVQCPDGICKTEINGIPLYRDVGHLNDYATKKLAESWLKQYGNPLIPPDR